MRSPARGAVELLLRAFALILLLILLLRALQQPPVQEGTVRVAGGELAGQLQRWSALPPASAHMDFGGVAPLPRERDWLAALVRSGMVLSWNGDGIAPVTVNVASRADPHGGYMIRLAAPPGSALELRDEAGLLDTLHSGGVGAERTIPAPGAWVGAIGGGVRATTVPGPAAVLRPVLVLASAGWEARFAITALEERGWTVHARVRVAPTSEITQGDAGAIGPARYSTVVVLDSTASAFAPAIVRHVRGGGGLVIAGTAAVIPALAAIAPARGVEAERGDPLRASNAGDREGLAHLRLTRLRDDAVVLEHRGDGVVAAARREGAGRVIQVGDHESWRVRMSPRDDGDEAHRAWWTRVAGSTAYVPYVSPADLPPDADAAPLAHLADALGGPSPAPPGTREPAAPVDTRLLAAVLFLALIAEWASRRLRGAR